MSKQTAVEWLEEQIKKDHPFWIDIFEQAKTMEREQIEDAYWEGGQDVPSNGKQCEKYYNETYKGDNK